MARFRTLDLFPVSLSTIRTSPGNYRTTATLRDWDDGIDLNVTLNSPGPIIAITPIKMRMQTEETLEAPEEGSAITQ